jgi:Flp pilus assembly protein protease CpaA
MEGLYLIISALIGAFATIASVLISKRNKKSSKDPILSETQNNQNIYSALEYVIAVP